MGMRRKFVYPTEIKKIPHFDNIELIPDIFAATIPEKEHTYQGLLNYYALYFLFTNTAQETAGTAVLHHQYQNSAGQ
jgi:hypothetical protein